MNIVIVAGSRTPMGCFQGILSSLTAPDLGAVVIKETLARSKVSGEMIDEVIMGCVLSAGLKQGAARQAMRKAGLPDHVGATTVNKICGSGMKAIMQAADSIKAHSATLVIAGGMESMTNAPYLLDRARSGYRMGHAKIIDHLFQEGLEDAESGASMGVLAQHVADQKGYTREQMDNFAIRSLTRAQHAMENGYFDEEIIAITIKDRKGEFNVYQDENLSRADLDKIRSLKPAFDKAGTITAANASSISDGASAMLITNLKQAEEFSLPVLAHIRAYASHSQHPSQFTIAPIGAIQQVLNSTGWSACEVDLWEINEAFAMVTMAAIDFFSLDANRVNINGGACALGHPLGSSGSRIILTLIYALKRLGKSKGIAALCIGGGEATALAIEIP